MDRPVQRGKRLGIPEPKERPELQKPGRREEQVQQDRRALHFLKVGAPVLIPPRPFTRE